MPKTKAPALNRIVRREWARLQMAGGCPGDETCLCRKRKAEFRSALQRVAAECAEIAEVEVGRGIPANITVLQRRDAVVKAAKRIREAFRLEEEDA